ncbi:MAG: general stress protein CsbD [Pseudomonadota bacterium]
MNWDQIENNWAAYKNDIRLNWEKITDAQLEVIAGKRDHLAGKIQVMYGIDQEEAEYQLSEWQENQANTDGRFYQSKSFSRTTRT